ncbi:hypothetical protein J6590_020986 [Homalodisca vitripennis]|nr:hypothetical protein J6590_020986 [Homalodisca vitripennis]
MTLFEKQSKRSVPTVQVEYTESRRMLQKMLLLHISLWLIDDVRSTQPPPLAPSSLHQRYRLSTELRRMLQKMPLLHISLWLIDDVRSTQPPTLAPSSCYDTVEETIHT